MITAADYIQLKAYARVEGIVLGVWGILVFACAIESLHDASLQMIASTLFITTPVVAYFRLRHFRDHILGGEISFRRGAAYLTFSFAYASLLMTAAAYIYFNFIDNGDFLMTVQQQLSAPEVQSSLKDAGISSQMLQQEMDMLAQTRPIDIAISVLSNGLVSGFLLSIILGFICRRSAAKVTNK